MGQSTSFSLSVSLHDTPASATTWKAPTSASSRTTSMTFASFTSMDRRASGAVAGAASASTSESASTRISVAGPARRVEG